MKVKINWEGGYVESLFIGGKEQLSARLPLFTVCLRGIDGDTFITDAFEGQYADGFYTGFEHIESVCVHAAEEQQEMRWRISVKPESGWAVEWVDFPTVSLPDLKAQDSENGGRILYPYNEGVIIEDRILRENSAFCSNEPKYPSNGCMPVFPNMICSQLMAYLWDDYGLYMGVHDPYRALKSIDFVGNGSGVTMRIRLFGGHDFGETFDTDWDIVWRRIDGAWQSAAEIYRSWFETALPPRAKKVEENTALPEWYSDSPLVVSYPVRGRFDTDDMQPNALYPYTNAMPVINAIKERTGSRIMTLLMHWEGTAPWAPPYVMPPYGDAANFDEFKAALHAQGDLLGVYCSGFGYTIQSNLDDYNCLADYEARNLQEGMCAGPDGKVAVSDICCAQRHGYDICPASPVGRDILAEAYHPLLKSDIDYAQILDQNHGGGQYLCYSREHGHPPVPGRWMTENMQQLLSEWNELSEKILFGCESAAAEPFIGNLLLSDNRYELGYHTGVPVPLYSYIYHEYLRNFMGNQVCCPFDANVDTLSYRLAYSFSIGDCMTVVLSPDGEFLTCWGAHPDEPKADKERALTLIANLTKFYKEKAKPYLCSGRMTSPMSFRCNTLSYKTEQSVCHLPSVLCSAWESGEGRVHIFVNPEPYEQTVEFDGGAITIPALDAVII
ncbi:MAG: hypothetical protein IJ460_06320 [Clostridia bacterium]|nr:hypothetical protein [Clostridia bacterium]